MWCVYSTYITERKTFIRKIKQGDKIRYAEVWNERQEKKVIQHHVRYLGSYPENLPDPSSFDIEIIHFGYLAQLILNDSEKRKEQCAICGRRLTVRYTYKRPIISLHGAKTTRVKVLACKNHPGECISIHDETEALLIPKCCTDLNVTIIIGLLRLRIGMKRHGIRAFLRTKGIALSTGTISNCISDQ